MKLDNLFKVIDGRDLKVTDITVASVLNRCFVQKILIR